MARRGQRGAPSAAPAAASNTAPAAHQSPDQAHKSARNSSAFQPYGNGSEPGAASPASQAASNGPGAPMSCALAAMAALSGGMPTGWPPSGAPHQLQQPLVMGPSGMAPPAQLPAANFVGSWPPGSRGNGLPAALDPSSGAAGGPSAANLLSWFRGLAPCELTRSGHHDATAGAPIEGGAPPGGHHPLPAAARGGPSGITNAGAPTNAELWAALQVLQQSSRAGALAQMSSQSP